MIQNLVFGILFLEILFWTSNIFIFLNVQGGIIRVFLISDLLAESLKAKKDHSFYNTVLLRKTSLILRTLTRLALGITFSRNTAKNLSEFTNVLRLQSLHISSILLPYILSLNIK